MASPPLQKGETTVSFKFAVALEPEQLETAFVEMMKEDYEWLELDEMQKMAFRQVLQLYMTSEEFNDWYEDTH